MEIERKFLLGYLPDLSGAEIHNISQGYISTSPDVRIRKDNDEYYLTMKGKGMLCREEHTLEITAEEYTNLLKKCDGSIISKVRYCLPLDAGEVAEIDIYAGALAGLQVVEVEFKTEAEAKAFQPPAWFSTEVTTDKSYKNSSLALNGLPH